MQSLNTRIFIGIAVPVLLALLVIGVALSIPRTGLEFVASDNHLVALIPNGNITDHGSDTSEYSAEEVLAFSTGAADQADYPGDVRLIIEEPDVLETHTEMRTLMHDIGVLTTALKQSRLTLHTELSSYPLQARDATITALPFSFWVQMCAGLAALIICILVWLPGDVSPGKYGFIISGFGYFFALISAGLYSSRELFIDESLFRALSLLNTFSSYLFMSGLALLFWNYPRVLLSPGLNTLLALFPLLLISLAAIPVHDHLAITIYLPFSLLLLLPLAGMVVQWRSNADNPKNRAVLRWILFMLVAITIPAILKLYAPIPQSVLLVSVVFVYAGIMIGITRHQMFDIERWSYRLWGWFLGGLTILMVDLLLASVVGLSQEASLVVAMGIVGWLYFPVRQWAWKRFFERKGNYLEEWLTLSVPELLRQRMDSNQTQQSELRLKNALSAVFRPLKLELSRDNARNGVFNRGTEMVVSGPDGQCIRLLHPGEGRHQFKAADLNIARMIVALDTLITDSLSARADGAREERQRIRQDLHDDLGAKLLRLLHRSQPDNKPLVREAINDLRILLYNTREQGEGLQQTLMRWHDEAITRCEDHGVHLNWQQSHSHARLSAGAIMQTGRALREAFSNAIRNMSHPDISVCVGQQEGYLILTVSNPFQPTSNAPEGAGEGEGMRNIHQRMEQIRGRATFRTHHDKSDTIWTVQLDIPIDVMPPEAS